MAFSAMVSAATGSFPGGSSPEELVAHDQAEQDPIKAPVSESPRRSLSASGAFVELRNKHRGVAWVAGREISGASLDPLVGNSVGWIAQTPFGWQSGVDSPSIRLKTSGGVLWGETDEGLATTTRLARERGIKTLLKPHIWVRGKWRGDIAMADEAAWKEWFQNYETFLLHYARLAEGLKIEALCIGTELHRTVKEKPDQWRRLIRAVRKVYSGQLTYAANWYQEFEDVSFWEELDFIGVQAYFPLRSQPGGTVAQLRDGWQQPLRALEAVSKKAGKPVLVTEVGYRSTSGASQKPWEWPQRGNPAPVDLVTQKRAYEAFFQEVWPQPWVAGVYWWKWYPGPSRSGKNDDFTPQGKPAEGVMGEYFLQARDSSRVP
ncbi:MAG: hypothetical protein K0U98_06305 [Deltaproteobacteria bacterium]|nr:hypothetical protein [Deltaproteobacteria bacterium]